MIIIMMTMTETTDDDDDGLDNNAADDDDLDKRRQKRTPDVSLLPAGRDLLFERPCKVKRFLALAAEWPDWPVEASAERESKREQEG